MTIAEFMTFVALVCNFDASPLKVSLDRKQDCMEYYVNCGIKDGGKVDRLTTSNCNMKAKEASKKWSK